MTQAIEHYTSMVPSGTYLHAGDRLRGRRSGDPSPDGRQRNPQFVGHWVPTILILGLYNKLVKQHGSH